MLGKVAPKRSGVCLQHDRNINFAALILITGIRIRLTFDRIVIHLFKRFSSFKILVGGQRHTHECPLKQCCNEDSRVRDRESRWLCRKCCTRTLTTGTGLRTKERLLIQKCAVLSWTDAVTHGLHIVGTVRPSPLSYTRHRNCSGSRNYGTILFGIRVSRLWHEWIGA